MIKSVRVHITGRVQGVWYRAWTCQQAGLKGLSGSVRNRRDGSVDAVFSGPGSDVDAMLSMCWDGPPLASVDGVATEPCEAPVGDGFHSLSTS